MNQAEARTLIIDVLAGIAPEADYARLNTLDGAIGYLCR